MKKPNKAFVLVLDLESDHSGLLKEEYTILKDRGKIAALLDFLREEQVKLSVFVVGELLEKFPDIVRLFLDYGCEFHCHSYSHDPDAGDSEEEIRKSKQAFVAFFGREPLGYRTPLGKISSRGIRLLEQYGFKFDASLQPSYFPNPFKYLFAKRTIHRRKGTAIIEIPSTSLSPLRITFSLSYLKLLGYNNFRRILKISRIPDTILFGSHLHDFFTGPELIKQLPFFWRRIYSRNFAKGMEYLARTIADFKKRGCSFEYISTIYEAHKDM